MKFVRKKINSIFTKLLVVVVCTGLCINIAIGAVFHQIFQNLTETPLERNIIQYANYLVEDMGIPPQFERAREIAETASLKIRYDGPEAEWSTSPDIPDINRWHEDGDVKIGKYRRHYLVQISNGPHRVTFDLERRFQQEDTHKKLAIMFIVLSTLILAGSYLLMRFILKPLKWLTEGVEHVSRGNLEHQVPVKRKDELAELADAFNNMTEQVKKMLHARERLMLDVSHELRSPLTRLKVALEFLPESTAKESLKEDVDVMESMITEILETARLRNGYATLNQSKTDLVPLIQAVVTGFEGVSPKVKAATMPTSLTAMLDRELCRTVLKNIIANAVKYSGSGEEPVEVSLFHKSPFVVIQVRDRGMGIPEEDLPYIFEPFYRVEKSRSQTIKGYGLGLNLCKTIMEAHKGKIEIESTLGEGTTASLFFPDQQEGE